MMEMSPETSLRLFEEGATLIFLNVPTATEIGIDMQSWSAGDKFKGIKMIPPGLHFVYFSAVNKEGNVAPRTGFFHFFQKTEVLVKKYDPRAEDISTAEVPAEEVERFKMNLKEMDKFLGPYPYDLWRKWVSLTNRINPEVMQARNPTSGVILSAPSLVLDEDQSAPPPDSKRTKLQEAEARLPKMTEDPDSKIKWTDVPSRNYPEGATPAEISRHFLDHSYKLDQLLSNYKKPEDLLAEVQFAFVTFLVGQNYSSFEQWKALVKIISFSEAAIVKYPKLYSDFLSDLYFQISNVDPEIFSDIVLNNNFMYSCVRQLQRNISDCNSVESTLRLKIERFCKFLEGKFRWIFDMEEEEEDDQPVVVDLSESISDQPVVVGSSDSISDNNLVTIQEMSEDIE